MESARDQCAKEGCKGCESCDGRYSSSGYSVTKPSLDISQASIEQLEAELQRKRNAKKNEAMKKKLQNEINALRKQIFKIEQKMKGL